MKRIKYLSLLAILLPFVLTAQKIDVSVFENMKARNIGPAGMSGRVTAIDVDPSDDDHIYAGTASGGIWESINGGISWEPIFDDQHVLSIGSIAICQSNPSLIWVGTGEGNPRNSQNSGAGVYKSLDGGKTWKFMGLKDTRVIHRVIIHRDDPETVFVGAMGSAWGSSEERGVFKTTDGGNSWEKVLYVDENTGIAELVVDPNNPNKLIAAMWDFRRTPWDFTSGGKGSGLYISHDGGKNWDQKTSEDGFPKGNLGRMGITVSAANSNVVYALVEAKENALYKSLDGGDSWKKHSTDDNIGNRPFYYYEIHADPTNENTLYSLYSYVSKSIDGGKTFSVIADYGNSVHPDHHAFWIHPTDSDYLIDGNDGGLNISRDGGLTWRFISNLPVGQFYHVNVDRDFPYQVYGGMQDNGSWAGPGFALKAGGIRNADWQELMFGDGFDVAPQPDNSRYGYAMSQGGNLGRWDKKTGRTEFIKPVHPDGLTLRYNWNAALAQNPFHTCGLYYGSQFLHKSLDCGKSWEIISPDLTTNDTTKQKQHKSGGLTIDATGAENHTTILAIAPSPVNENVIWVGTDDGNLHLTIDGGNTWTNLNDKIKAPDNAWIPQIQASTYDAGEAFVVINNYRQNDWSAYMYHTIDYGKNWDRMVDDSQVKGFVCSVLQDPKEKNLLFLGTDTGLYMSFDAGKNWNHWDNGLPSVQIRDLALQPDFEDLAIATFGRAFWVLDDIRPLRSIASSNGKVLEESFAVFESPDAYQVSTRSVNGIRFIAQGEFVGDNKMPGATLNIWIKKDDKKGDKKEESMKHEESKPANAEAKIADKKKKPNELKVNILDSKGDTVRSFTRDIKDEGFVRVNWNMRGDGVSFPSRRAPRNNFGPPSGNPVLPGTYKAILSWKGQKDSTNLVVKTDPRVSISHEDLLARQTLSEKYEDLVERSTKAFNLLKEARKSITLVEKMLINLPDSTKKQIVKMNKEQGKKIDELEALYMMPDGLKGIQRDNSKLTGQLGSVRRYLGSMWDQPSPNALTALNLVEKQVLEVVDTVNQYIEEDWKEYTDKIGEISFNPFGEMKIVEK